MKDDIPTWGDFQSLIQLGVALNTAFAIISSYAGRFFQKDLLLITSYIAQAEYYEKDGHENAVDLISDMDHLRQKIDRSINKFEIILDGFIKKSCAFISIVSLYLLIYSSYFYNTYIDYLSKTYLIVQYFPFLFGLLYGIYLSGVIFPNYSNERHKLFLKLKLMEDVIRKS